MYPGGFPLRKDQVSFEDKNVQEIFLKRCDDIYNRHVPPNFNEERFLRYYVLYYIHAPIWVNPEDPEYIQELLNTPDLEDMSLNDLIGECMKYGIDPL
jgi:hypothetical protein